MIVYEMWTWRETVPSLEDLDLTGFKVEAVDGSIGKVDEATHETGGSFIVVDTGPWIFGKKVMLPAGTIQSVDPEAKTVFVDRTKEDIKNAPEFDPDRYKEDIYREKLGGYYQDFYKR
jgi:hypothetical protein